MNTASLFHLVVVPLMEVSALQASFTLTVVTQQIETITVISVVKSGVAY